MPCSTFIRICYPLTLLVVFFAFPSSANCQSNLLDTKPITSSERFIEGDQVKDGISLVGFEALEDGSLPTRSHKKHIGNDFIFAGVKLSSVSSEGIGVISTGYKFKKSLSGTRAITTLEQDENMKKRPYRGELRVDFCSPEGVAKTVTKMGMMVEITHPRHNILSVYNTSGHRLGTCESAKLFTSFIGLESDRPIAFAVLRKNLDLETENLQEDFAVDDIVFGGTKPDAHRNLGEKSTGQLKDGDFIRGFSSELYADISRPEKSISVMLNCGSVLNCTIEEGQLRMVSAPDVHIDMEERVIGVWGNNSECCYPNGSDFQAGGESVLVTPLFRLPLKKADIDLNSGTAKLDLSILEARFQPWEELAEQESYTKLSNRKEVLQSLKKLGVDENGAIDLTSMHSLWFLSPPLRSELGSILVTMDGQEFVLGSNSPFSLHAVDNEKIVILHNGKKIEFTKDQIKVYKR